MQYERDEPTVTFPLLSLNVIFQPRSPPSIYIVSRTRAPIKHLFNNQSRWDTSSSDSLCGRAQKHITVLATSSLAPPPSLLAAPAEASVDSTNSASHMVRAVVSDGNDAPFLVVVVEHHAYYGRRKSDAGRDENKCGSDVHGNVRFYFLVRLFTAHIERQKARIIRLSLDHPGDG